MRLIDADALMKELAKFVAPSNNSDFAEVPNWNDAVSLVGSAPTIEPKADLISKSALLASTDKEEIHKYEIALFPTIEPKKGKWIDKSLSIKNVPTEACSVCGEWSYGDDMAYCPHCGAKMEGEESETY